MNSTSPSIYVVFESLYATDACGFFGPQYIATTLAFDQNELSTTVGYRWDAVNKTLAYDPQFIFDGQTFTQATWEDQ